jgi:hypothetical protein
MNKNKLYFFLAAMAVLCSWNISAREYHVSKTGTDNNPGSMVKPFLTIGAAVKVAFPGDTITVHEGTYREWVNPLRGGESDSRRIVYRAAPGEKVEIKGSEVITGWQNEGNGVWKVIVPDSFFGDYHPYQDSVHGDWFNRRGRVHHTGEVFLNGKSLYEKESLEKVRNPVAMQNITDPEGSTYTWYCESSGGNTTLWANFHAFDPNRELVEISARRTCFYPEKPGVNYLTISGFYFSQAATQWGAPTAEQIGMISTHWNKGWIIENNVISDSKCSGITLGKERGTGHNVWTRDLGNINNDGNIHYIEVTFNVLRNGWNRDNIGSHIVRNNTIFNCEQTGICGSMGAAFSTIENNHIYNIWTKRQFDGAEIGGIKFHAPVDTQIKNNRIHHCGRGLWLDWMTQGTRVSSNLFYGNDREDLFLEVNHGPYVVDNNLFLSPIALRIQSQGGAFLHNLIAGAVTMYPEHNRFTPYFLPHSTDIAALTTILAGDDRFYNNLFVGNGTKSPVEGRTGFGLGVYDNARLPVFINDNFYCFGASPSENDVNFSEDQALNPGIHLAEQGDGVFLNLNMSQTFFDQRVKIIDTGMLGKALIPKAPFDNPDGTELKVDADYFGNKRTPSDNLPGPFVNPGKGKVVLEVW